MHPILFSIGRLTVRMYGLLLALGFALAIAMAALRARRKGIDPEMVLDVGFWAILSGIVGARIFYVVQFPDYYFSEPLRMFKIWEGGLIFYGGLIMAVLATAVYLKLKKGPILAMGDLLAPSIALGQGIGRIGCFAAGCCYGLPFQGFWAVTFRDGFSLAPLNAPLHPTQLYLSAADFAVMGMLLAIDRKPAFAGRTFLSYLMLYSVVRFLMEFLRGDMRGTFLGTVLSPAQGTGIIVFVLAAAAWFYLGGRARKTG